MDDPWPQIIIAVLQAASGAAAALIGVVIAQRSAHRERKHRLFERLYEPLFGAHRDLFLRLVDLQDQLRACRNEPNDRLRQELDRLSAAVRQQLIWLDEGIANAALAIIESSNAAVASGSVVGQTVLDDIVRCQRQLQRVIGVPDFLTVVEKLRK